MDTNLYWRLRGTYAERKTKLSEWDKSLLEACILDAEYNDFLSARANFKDGEPGIHGRGKRLPYIGWYWRHLNFSEGRLPIGNCGEFVGFIANNKWDYDERHTTPEEFASIMTVIDEAMRLNEQGGSLADIVRTTNEKLEELWALLQTMRV